MIDWCENLYGEACGVGAWCEIVLVLNVANRAEYQFLEGIVLLEGPTCRKNWFKCIICVQYIRYSV
jgi:hypothetical protein